MTHMFRQQVHFVYLQDTHAIRMRVLSSRGRIRKTRWGYIARAAQMHEENEGREIKELYTNLYNIKNHKDILHKIKKKERIYHYNEI